MDAPTQVIRTVDLGITPDQLWELIGNGERWPDWMVDHADVDVEPGAHGRVAEDGVDRDVQINDVVDGERISFEWWPTANPEQLSAVELRVLPAVGGSQLHIVETFPATASAHASAATWSLRATRLRADSRTRLQFAA